ncbi:MAG: deoxyribodipyrimidine photo-lyase [Cyanobacteriota bacterium]
MRNIFWFRNDLRFEDNIGFYNALEESREVIPVYIISDSFINSPEINSARVNFLFDSLNYLNKQLEKYNSKLIIRTGNPEKELITLARETNAKGIYFNKSYYKKEIATEKNIIGNFAKSGYRVKSFKDSVIFEEKDISVATRKGLLDFDKFKKKWLAKIAKQEPIINNFTPKNYDKLIKKASNIYTINQLNVKNFGFSEDKFIIEVNEEIIKNAIENIIKENNHNNNFFDYSVFFSIYTRFGNISIRNLLANIDLDNLEKEPFLAQILDYIIKNDYYAQIEYLTPDEEINEDFSNDWEEYNYFLTICNSKSGLPIIDALMKQIEINFTINDNLKNILINFFMYVMQINTNWIKKYLICKTINGDSYVSKNIIDYYKKKSIKNFDLIKESLELDLEGNYIKHFLPILAEIPQIFIHEPYKMPISLQKKIKCLIGEDYPYPIIKEGFIEIEHLTLIRE